MFLSNIVSGNLYETKKLGDQARTGHGLIGILFCLDRQSEFERDLFRATRKWKNGVDSTRLV